MSDSDPASCTFDFDGTAVPALAHDTVATALTRAGFTDLRLSRQGEPRGVFCGIGLCHDCLVEVDGRQAQRACMTSAQGVKSVHRHVEGKPAQLARLAPEPDGGDLSPVRVDLAIVGAGPAGIMAALTASGRSLSTVLIDERPYAGGQYFKPDVTAPRDARKDGQHQAGDILRTRLAMTSVRHLTGHTVWYADRNADDDEDSQSPTIALGVIGDGKAKMIIARAIILATGAYERPPLVPGWTLPGVMTIGAAQSFVRSYGVVPGKRIVIAGNGPLGLQLATELIGLGSPPLAVVERGEPGRLKNVVRLATGAWYAPDLVAKGAGMRAALWRAGVPLLEGWQVTAFDGNGKVETVHLGPVDGGQQTQAFAVDTVCVGEGFLPQAELARALGCECDKDPVSGFLIPRRDGEGASSKPGIWIAGDGGGMGGAQIALAQGRIAADAALGWLGTSPVADRAPRRRLARARGFQHALWMAYAAPNRAEPVDRAILCRCESVSFGAARQAVAKGARSLGALKRETRLGMGRCQGRYCSGPASLLTRDKALFAPQAPARPVPIAALALEKPEWGGHRKAEAPTIRKPDLGNGQAVDVPRQVDLAIIGAGIMGVSAALRASELGLDTAVIDRGAINGESSGGNAGSLHLQLLSFDFGAKTGGRSDALLQTLPLQRDAIALWLELETSLDTPFEIALTGGLMLAENPDHIDFLKRKIASERRHGIEVELVGPADIHKVAPAVSPRMVAGAWCPGEGKINPLLATPALARAARDNGARFFEGVQVVNIGHERDGYAIQTDTGLLKARRIVLAAGGWTGALGALLGVHLPVDGAPLQMIVTETAPPIAPCLLAHADRHLTMKQAAAGNIIIGGAWSAGTIAGTGRPRILKDSLEGNLWVAEQVVPALSGLHALRSWAAMNVDIDGAPLLGPLPGLPGAVVVAGANGYTLGPLLGRIAAETVAAGSLPAAYRRFSPDRFVGAM